MGRNQIDLILLLSFLLIGSFFYSKNLKKQHANIKSHCDIAQVENRSSLQKNQYKLLNFLKSYPLYEKDIIYGIDKINTSLLGSSFLHDDKMTIFQVQQELNRLTPFKALKKHQINSAEILYEKTIEEGILFFQELKKKDDRQLEFSILVNKLEEEGDLLRIELKPYNKYVIQDSELYAFSNNDSIKIEAPYYSYCGNLRESSFATKNNKGIYTPFNTTIPKNIRP